MIKAFFFPSLLVEALPLSLHVFPLPAQKSFSGHKTEKDPLDTAESVPIVINKPNGLFFLRGASWQAKAN
jgi:hypothetical protein